MRLGAGLPEEETAPEPPGVGQRRRRAEDREADEEGTVLELGGEEELIREEANRQGERDQRGRRKAARGREQRHGLPEPPEFAQAVLAGRLRDRAGGQEQGALGYRVDDHVEGRPAGAVLSAEAVHGDHEPVRVDGGIGEQLLEDVAREREKASDRYREEAE